MGLLYLTFYFFVISFFATFSLIFGVSNAIFHRCKSMAMDLGPSPLSKTTISPNHIHIPYLYLYCMIQIFRRCRCKSRGMNP